MHEVVCELIRWLQGKVNFLPGPMTEVTIVMEGLGFETVKSNKEKPATVSFLLHNYSHTPSRSHYSLTLPCATPLNAALHESL